MAAVSLLRKQAPKFSVPNLSDVSEEFRRLTDKRDKLAARLGKLQAEHADLMAEIARTVVSQSRRERDQRVAALLDDETAMVVSKPHVRLSEVNREISDVKAALAVLEDQIGQARYRASEKIVEDVRPAYAQRVAANCDALLKLRESSADYLELTNALQEKDISWLQLEPLPVSFAGNPHDRYSKTAIYLREAAKAGYFDYSRIPAELR